MQDAPNLKTEITGLARKRVRALRKVQLEINSQLNEIVHRLTAAEANGDDATADEWAALRQAWHLANPLLQAVVDGLPVPVRKARRIIS